MPAARRAVARQGGELDANGLTVYKSQNKIWYYRKDNKQMKVGHNAHWTSDGGRKMIGQGKSRK